MTTRLFQFRFADAEQYWLITFTFFRCQRMKQSAATGMLNGLALDYLSTIFPVMGLDKECLSGQLNLAISGFMLLVFMTTQPFQ